MIFSVSDKWREAGGATKVTAIFMALATFFTLICGIILFAISVKAGVAQGYYFIWMVVSTGINALLALGIFKVSKIARFFTIWVGIIALIYFITGVCLANSDGLIGTVAKLALKFMPEDAGALLLVFIAPSILQILSMILLLFVCKKDFKRVVE